MKKENLVNIGRYFLSFMFVFGAISKLLSMPFFDNMVAELFLGKNYFDSPRAMYFIQWLTRILVSFELLLGLALLQNKCFKKIILPATLGMLILFTVHLFYDAFSKPNGFTEGNCGCFGDILPMTNLESIIKNVIGILVGIWVWIKFTDTIRIKTLVPAILVGLTTLFTLAFGVKKYDVNPIVISDFDDSEQNDFVEQEADTVPIYQYIDTALKKEDDNTTDEKIIEKPIEKTPELKSESKLPKTLETISSMVPELKSRLSKNESTLVCLFSMSCGHCQEVYREICEAKSSKKIPYVYLVNYGTDYEQNYFFNQSGGCKDPHTLFGQIIDFKRMLEGKSYPRLLLVENGKVKKEWDVDTYEKEAFYTYFGIEETTGEAGGLDLKKDDPFGW
jgi:hypothetical protein